MTDIDGRPGAPTGRALRERSPNPSGEDAAESRGGSALGRLSVVMDLGLHPRLFQAAFVGGADIKTYMQQTPRGCGRPVATDKFARGHGHKRYGRRRPMDAEPHGLRRTIDVDAL